MAAPPVDGVPVNGVVECVVRNAMDKLLEKHQDLRTGPPSRRKLQLARFLEETRRQFVSVLALVRWQKRRLAVTRQCEDLVESLQVHGWHMTTVSERLSFSAEEMAHTHRTPMFDVRTAVDVLATGTYKMLPTLNMRQILPPKVQGCENEEEVGRHLDFLIRSQLLNTKIPSGLSSVQVSEGKLVLTCDGEFELVLSMKLDQPGRPWKVDKVGILVKAAGMDDPTTDILAMRLESRMAVVENPLMEAFSILTDCCRLRTWQILNQQAFTATSGPRLAIETALAGNSFTLHYWPDSYVLTFESLLAGNEIEDEIGELVANKPSATDVDTRMRLPPPHIIMVTHAQAISRVQIKHKPQLVGADGRPLQLTLNRDDLNLEVLIHTAIAEHSKCRLRLLHVVLLKRKGLLASMGITAEIGLDWEELVISVDGKPRLSFVVDSRNGEFSARDMDTHAAGGGAVTGLLEALSSGVESAADALMKWRSHDMLAVLLGLLPLYGVRPSHALLAYSRTQSLQLADITKDRPTLFLQLAGDNMLNSGFVGSSRSLPRPAAQDVSAIVVTCDVARRAYKYTLVVLSVSKGQAAYTEDIALPEEEGGGAGGKKGAFHPQDVFQSNAARELSKVLTLAVRRVNILKLRSQLDTQEIPYRDVDGTILFRLPLEPLVTRELKLRLDGESKGVSMGGLSGWSVEIALTTTPFRGEYKDPRAVLPSGLSEGYLESCVRIDDSKLLVAKMPCVHANSVQQFRQVVDGILNMTRLGLELEKLLGTGDGSNDFLRGAVEIEAMSLTTAVLRLKESKELVTVRYKIKSGFDVACKAYPFASQIGAALNNSLDVNGSLTALVKFTPVLAALKSLKCCEGDYAFLPYTLTGFGVLFRGTFGVHFRILTDDSNAYSISDMCPHSSQKPMPATVDPTFMSHAAHTAAPVSAMVDTLWAIPHWSLVIHALCEAANASTSSSPGGSVKAESAALSHVNAHRYAAVCTADQLSVAMAIVHRHLAASHLKVFGFHFLAKLTAKIPAPEGKKIPFIKGHHAVSLQVLSPQTALNREDRLLVTFEQIPNPPPGTTDVLSDADVQRLQALFQTHVSAPPYAANHMKSFLQLLSVPVSALRSFCDLLRELSPHETFAEFALAPAYLVTWAESKERPGPSYKGPTIIVPRTEGASAVKHDEREEKVTFMLRLWNLNAPTLELCLVYAYSQNKLYLGGTNALAVHPWAAAAASAVGVKMSTPLDVPTGSLWPPVKQVLGAIQAAAPPQAP